MSFSAVDFWSIDFGVLTIFFWIGMLIPSLAEGETMDVWIGTSSAPPSRGIYHCTLDGGTGKLSEARLVASISGPGFLARHPQLEVLYAAGTLEGKPSVVAYRITSDSAGARSLEMIGSAEVGDGGATHLSIDKQGQTLLTAQYGGGSTAAFAILPDGSIRERTQLLKHQGGSRVVAGRQDAPHAHWVGFSPDERFAFVPDLGLDQVLVYRVDLATAMLTPHGAGECPPGSGPRHMKFHPSGQWIYVLNELDLTVSVFDYDRAAGRMTRKQTVLAVPKDELAREQFTSASEIRVHPSGQYVYSANRGHDTITLYSVDEATGELEVVERTPVRGATPRNFNLDPEGNWLLAAGQDSHTLSSFAVDRATGRLTYNRSIIHVPSPICVLFAHE